MQSSLRNAQNHFILHVDTNDLGSGKIAVAIANTIIDLERPGA